MGDICPQAIALRVEAFTGVSRPLKCVIFLFKVGQEFIELIIVRTMDVMCQLQGNIIGVKVDDRGLSPPRVAKYVRDPLHRRMYRAPTRVGVALESFDLRSHLFDVSVILPSEPMSQLTESCEVCRSIHRLLLPGQTRLTQKGRVIGEEFG